MFSRKLDTVIKEEAKKHGFSVQYKHGSKHYIMILTRGGKTKKHPIATNKSKCFDNQVDWIRQNFRKFDREFGETNAI